MSKVRVDSNILVRALCDEIDIMQKEILKLQEEVRALKGLDPHQRELLSEAEIEYAEANLDWLDPCDDPNVDR